MSTSSIIVGNEEPQHRFQLTNELFEDDCVYLELWGDAAFGFEAHNNHVKIRIPGAIWEVVRQHSGIDMQFADWSDDQVEEYAKKAVDERYAEYQDALQNENERSAKFLSVCGLFVMGKADDPLEEQYKSAITFYTMERDKQSSIAAEIREMLAVKE